MSLLRNLADGLRWLFRKERIEGELDEELRGFLDMSAQEIMDRLPELALNKPAVLLMALISVDHRPTTAKNIIRATWTKRMRRSFRLVTNSVVTNLVTEVIADRVIRI